MSQRVRGHEVSITITLTVRQVLLWCTDCRNLSVTDDRHWERNQPTCRRGRGDIGRTTCYGQLRELRGDKVLVDAILAAFAVGGWDAAVAVWLEAGAPKL